MYSNREELASTRQHLHCLQTKTEKSLNTLILQFKLWSQDFRDQTAKNDLLQQCMIFRESLREHFSEVSADALFESAVALHPSLAPQLHEIDRQHDKILSQLDQLIEEFESPITSPDLANDFVSRICQLHDQIIATERLERHILEMGWI